MQYQNIAVGRLITESSCFLCRKSICTSAHILGACKIALHQGRFSFRHDKVLCELVLILLLNVIDMIEKKGKSQIPMSCNCCNLQQIHGRSKEN